MSLKAFSQGLSIYIHWPFCHRICPYCDFNVYKDSADHPLKGALFTALLKDIEYQSELLAKQVGIHSPKDIKIVSLYFGGGTPSLLSAFEIEAIINLIKEQFPLSHGAEITLELNPTDGESDKIEAFLGAGINRLSIGLQSLHDEELIFLGRNHRAAEGRRALEKAILSCKRVSADLIGALAGQALSAWEFNLKQVADMGVEHISPYGLTIEPDTAFGRAARRGRILGHDEAAWEAFFDKTDEVLSDHGFDRYEVSNHARSKLGQSRHNVHIWEGGDYMGIGPGAHGRLSLMGVRHCTLRAKKIKDYIDEINAQRLNMTSLSPMEACEETILFGLRQKVGINWSALGPKNAHSIKAQLELGSFDGFIEHDEWGFRASQKGVKVLDHLTYRLVSAL